MIEKPKPLTLFGIEPKQTLKMMLEMSDKKDKGENFPSPLDGIDPMTLDELTNRIDTCLSLGQVPDPKDLEKQVNIYWAMREQFNLEQQLGITTKPKRSKPEKIDSLAALDLLKGGEG
jgi:hypothetical protein